MTEQLGAGLGPRDRQLLTDVADLRLVTGGQLQRLAFAGPDATTTNSRIARRALQRLTERGLLQRLERRVGGIRAGSSSYVYAITPAGSEAVGRHLSRRSSTRPSLTFMRHQLAVAEVYVALRGALHAGRLEGLVIETEPTCWRPLDDGSALKPDLSVVATRPHDEQLAFIEVDNNTEHAEALARKLALYRAHYDSGREQAQEGVFPEVLWLSDEPRRLEQLERAFERNHQPAGLHRALTTTAGIHYITEGGEYA